MRNLSIVLNVILLVAVGILYYLHFQTKPEPVAKELPVKSVGSGTGIYFVNSDSLLARYDFYKQKKKEFEAEQDKIRAELKRESDNLQRDIEKYQEQAIGMTDLERAQKEEQLGMKQQQLMQRKEDLFDRLDEVQAKSSDELFTRLNDYLKRHKNMNFDYVLGMQKGGGILFANDSLDITNEVVEGLNDEYNAKK